MSHTRVLVAIFVLATCKSSTAHAWPSHCTTTRIMHALNHTCSLHLLVQTQGGRRVLQSVSSARAPTSPWSAPYICMGSCPISRPCQEHYPSSSLAPASQQCARVTLSSCPSSRACECALTHLCFRVEDAHQSLQSSACIPTVSYQLNLMHTHALLTTQVAEPEQHRGHQCRCAVGTERAS